jgi:hypothetical protein
MICVLLSVANLKPIEMLTNGFDELEMLANVVS